DVAGRSSEATTELELDATTFTGRFVRTSTDFTADLGGETVAFTRQYDSLAAGNGGSFGAGWTLVWRDLRLDSAVSSADPLRAGSRVIVDTPDGGRAAFTFAPEQVTGNGFTY